MYKTNWKFFKRHQVTIPILQNVVRCIHMSTVQIGVLLNLMALKPLLKKYLTINIIICSKRLDT